MAIQQIFMDSLQFIIKILVVVVDYYKSTYYILVFNCTLIKALKTKFNLLNYKIKYIDSLILFSNMLRKMLTNSL